MFQEFQRPFRRPHLQRAGGGLPAQLLPARDEIQELLTGRQEHQGDETGDGVMAQDDILGSLMAYCQLSPEQSGPEPLQRRCVLAESDQPRFVSRAVVVGVRRLRRTGGDRGLCQKDGRRLRIGGGTFDVVLQQRVQLQLESADIPLSRAACVQVEQDGGVGRSPGPLLRGAEVEGILPARPEAVDGVAQRPVVPGRLES